MRKGQVSRRTEETSVEVELLLDGKGLFEGSVPSGFFHHMLNALFRHSGISCRLRAEGDVHVDLHHTVEDTGIVLGKALSQALGDKKGIVRFGHAIVPMDEALVMAAVDISGRGSFFMEGRFPSDRVGDFPVELVEEFFVAFARNAGVTLHVRILSGRNTHHTVEALFKAVARALKEAVAVVSDSIPSTKGVL